MTLRAYRPEDLETLKQLHGRLAHGYPVPDFDDPAFVVGVISERQQELQAAAFLRITAEAYLLMDPDAGTPEERWQSLLQIHESVKGEANKIGLPDVNCWIPPDLENGKRFGRRLEKLGWRQDKWANYTFRLR